MDAALKELTNSPHMGVGEFDDSLVSDSEIVPDDMQLELIRWRDTFQQGAFRIGDIANDLILNQKTRDWNGEEKRVTSARIYRAVGRFCGKSGRTVRYYAETSAFYSAKIRTEFEVVPFSHFVLARSMGDRWRDVLEFSALHPDYSAERVLYEIEPDRVSEPEKGDGIAESMPYMGIPANVMGIPNSFLADRIGIEDKLRETSHVYGRAATCLSAVGDLIAALDRFERYLKDAPADDDTRKEIITSASELRTKVSRLTIKQ